jgi:hypothetical protein
MGLFALVVVGISLWRLLAEKDLPTIYRIKRLWGRTLGLGLLFVTNVGLPLIVGIVFVSKGIVSFDPLTTQPFVPALPHVQTLLSEFAEARIAAISTSLHNDFLLKFDLLMP